MQLTTLMITFEYPGMQRYHKLGNFQILLPIFNDKYLGHAWQKRLRNGTNEKMMCCSLMLDNIGDMILNNLCEISNFRIPFFIHPSVYMDEWPVMRQTVFMNLYLIQ